MQRNRNNAFLKGTISLSLSVIITKIMGVAFKVPLSYVLGDEGMGYFNTAYAIYGFFYILCTAGVPKSLTLVLSEHRLKSNGNVSDECVLRCGLKLFLLIGGFTTLLNIICAPAIAGFIGNKKALLSIIAVAPSILFVSMSGVIRGYMNSREKLTVIAVSQLIEAGVKLFFGLMLSMLGVKCNMSIHMISALAILGITVGSIISFVYLNILSKKPKIGNKRRQNSDFNATETRNKIIKNALPIALSSSLLNLSSTIDLAIIIRRLVSAGMSEGYANSIYGNYTTLAVPMFNLVISVLAPIATSYMPRLSQMNLSGKREEFVFNLNRLLWITLIISTPASLAFYFYSFDLLDVLFSTQSSAIGAEMLMLLSLGVCLLSALTVINTALESQGKIAATVISLLLGCAVKLCASYLLIGRGSVGILGAPLGTVISYVVSLMVSLIILGGSRVKTFTFPKIVFLYSIGLVCFYPFYKMIYCSMLFRSSFISMSFSIGISFLMYFALLGVVYFIFKHSRVFKMHKNGY